MDDYKIKPNQNHIFQFTVPESHETADIKIFSKAYMSVPINGVRFYMIEKGLNQAEVAPLIISRGQNKGQNQHSQNLYILSLKDITIGNGTLLGMIVWHVSEYIEFLNDLHAGKIDLAIIDIDKTLFDKNVGILIEEITDFCGSLKEPAVHIFFTDKDELVDVNYSMKQYFMKYNGQMIQIDDSSFGEKEADENAQG